MGCIKPPRHVTEPTDRAGGRLAFGLSDAERQAIRNYTLEKYSGLDSYHTLNPALSIDTIDKMQQSARESNILSAALSKLPVHEGTVLRGTIKPLTAAELAKYEPGDFVVEPRFLSSTVDPEEEFSKEGGNAIWVIESKNGHSLKDLADPSMANEQEILFDRFPRFQVLAKEYDDELQAWVIYMEETDKTL